MDNTIDSRVAACIVASKQEPQELGCWVDGIELIPDRIAIAVLDERDCSLIHDTVAVVDVGPNTFDIAVVDVVDDIDVAGLGVASREVIVALSLP